MIVCEIGLNHLGNEELASLYLEAICRSSADAATFQIREAKFYENPLHSHLVLSDRFYLDACARLKKHGKKFGFAVSAIDQIEKLAEIGADLFKVLSWDILNRPIIDRILSTNIGQVFVSTGMSDFEEIAKFSESVPNNEHRIRLIHTQLSEEIEHVNLRSIPKLRERFRFPVAYGHHCKHLDVLYLSLAFDPSDIFIYIKNGPEHNYPDDAFAVPIVGLSDVTNALNSLPFALGRTAKLRMENEIEKARQNSEFI